MNRVLAALRAVGIVLGAWILLALAGWVAGVLPPLPGYLGSLPGVFAPSDGAIDAGQDVSLTQPDGGLSDAGHDAGVSTAADAGVIAPSSLEEVAAEASLVQVEIGEAGIPRIRVCAPSSTPPTLDPVALLSAERQQLLVGCGSESHILALQPASDSSGRPPIFVRIARLDYSTAMPSASRRSTHALVHDLTGDGLPDVVLASLVERAQGVVRGGSLHLLAGHPTGVFEVPVELASFAAVGLHVADLLDSRGEELLVLNSGASQGRGPGEIWVFSSQPAPTRLAKIPSVKRAASFVVLDLDGDEHLDLVSRAHGKEEAVVHFGDGTGSFATTQSFALDGLLELAVADLDGDGSEDLLMRGASLAQVRSGHREELAVSDLVGRAYDGLAVGNFDDDSAAEIWLLAGDTIELYDSVPGAVRAVYRFPAATLPTVIAVAELDALAGADLALLVRAGADAPWELVVLPTSAESLTLGARNDLQDAPLSLRIRLP